MQSFARAPGILLAHMSSQRMRQVRYVTWDRQGSGDTKGLSQRQQRRAAD